MSSRVPALVNPCKKVYNLNMATLQENLAELKKRLQMLVWDDATGFVPLALEGQLTNKESRQTKIEEIIATAKELAKAQEESGEEDASGITYKTAEAFEQYFSKFPEPNDSADFYLAFGLQKQADIQPHLDFFANEDKNPPETVTPERQEEYQERIDSLRQSIFTLGLHAERLAGPDGEDEVFSKITTNLSRLESKIERIAQRFNVPPVGQEAENKTQQQGYSSAQLGNIDPNSLPRHRKTGYMELDDRIPFTADAHMGQKDDPSVFLREAFYVEKHPDPLKTNIFFISPTGKDADGLPRDSQRVMVYATGISFEGLTKAVGRITTLAVYKGYRKHADQSIEAAFFVDAAEAWKNPEGKSKTMMPGDKPGAPEKSTEFGYTKEFYKVLLDRRVKILADIRAQRARIELLQLDASQTKTLFTRAKTLPAFFKHVGTDAKGISGTDPLSVAYAAAITSIIAQKPPEWAQQQLDIYKAAHNGQEPSPDALEKFKREALLTEVMAKQTAGKSFHEVLQSKLLRPVTYTDPETGQTKEVTHIAHNLHLHSDELISQPLFDALKQDPENLLAWAAQRAVMSSTAAHVTQTVAFIDPEKGQFSVLDSVPSKGTDFLMTDINKNIERGWLFRPNPGDSPIPGLSPAGITEYSTEAAERMVWRSLGKDSILRSPNLDKTQYDTSCLNDKITEAAGHNEIKPIASLADHIAHAQERIANEEKQLALNDAELKREINNSREQMGLPPIGRKAPSDPKAALAVLELVVGSILSQMFKGLQEMEGNLGLF